MKDSDQIQFVISHNDKGSTVTDLTVTVCHAGNIVKDGKLLAIFLDLLRLLKVDGFDIHLFQKDGDDK